MTDKEKNIIKLVANNNYLEEYKMISYDDYFLEYLKSFALELVSKLNK